MAGAAISDSATAAKHPFVGEHANASAVHHPSGTISQRMTAKPQTHDKHAHMRGGEGLFEPKEQTWQERANEALFGKYES